MVETQIEYIDELRCKLTHLNSGAVIFSDAPKDNHGKGESFSPTDLVATAYGACFATILGIAAQERNMDIQGLKIKAIKEMSANPRRIARITLDIYFPKSDYNEREKLLIDNIVKTCPVRQSLNPEIEFVININYGVK